MKKTILVLLSGVFTLFFNPMLIDFAASQATPTYKMANASISSRIDDLLSVMTLDEKIGQLVQMDFSYIATNWKLDLSKVKGYVVNKNVGSFLNVAGADVKVVQDIAISKTRLGIPIIFGKDAVHGHALYPNGTVFPMPLGLASSWDPALVAKTARVTAVEASATGIKWNFDPVLDVARDPRWGRIIEGFGEDPYLVYRLGSAKVAGYQGESLSDKTSVLATGKHFVAYSNTVGGRDYSPADISMRTLYDIFLPPFKGAVDSGIGSIMTSFNDIQGTPATANEDLVRKLLKDQWGFDGIVVSDYDGVSMLYHTQFVTATEEEAVKKAILSGVDVDMTSGFYLKYLKGLVTSGSVPMQIIDDAVKRVLRAKFRLGLFEDPSTDIDETKLNTSEHKAVALDAARHTLVLLKNEKLLPLSLKDIKTIAVIGPLADDAQNQLGGWTMQQPRDNVKTVLDGIKKIAGNSVNVTYAKGCNITEDVAGVSSGGGVLDLGIGGDEAAASIESAVKLASGSDVIVAVLGEASNMSSEPNSRSSLDLPGRQQELLESLYNTGKPIILVLINGRPLTINWAKSYIPAIIEAWFPGQEGGTAVAEAIFGQINPSGKLAITFPKTVGQIPLWYYHYPQKNWDHEAYGKRYIDLEDEPLFAFGYGLTYSAFEYSNLTVVPTNTIVRIGFSVTNTSKVAGEETVQVYISDRVASMVPIDKKLYQFDKALIDPGHTRRFAFTISRDELATLTKDGTRVFESGDFDVLVGSSSKDIKLTASFKM